jgi:predicted N-acyltransferase
MKKNIATEINRNKKAGVTIRKVKDLNEQENRLYDLLNGNCIKHNKTSLPFQENFLSQLKKNLGDDLVIYRSIKNNRISGMGIMLRSGDTGYLPFVGVDHHLSQNDATFFNILFYRPITDAITENIKILYYGNAMYDMKIRRGCKIEKAFFFYKPCHPLFKPASSLWFYLHQFWYQKKLPQPQNLPGSL